MTQAENLERLMDKKSLKIRKQNCSAENADIIDVFKDQPVCATPFFVL